MSYLHEPVLREKAEEYILIMKETGINGEIVMIRDYMVKISVEREGINYGNIIIDYRASKGTFSIRTQELKDKSKDEFKDGPKDGFQDKHQGKYQVKPIEDILNMLWIRLEEVKVLNKNEGFVRGGKSGMVAEPKKSDKTIYEIYADGSFLNNKVGYGVVILKNGQPVKEISESVTDPIFLRLMEGGGEITAIIEALTWCKNEGIDEVSIFYDLINLEKWATGEFAANIPMTKAYRDFIQNSGIDIHWNKVLAHSGIKWNERADELAKEGALKVTD